MSAATCDECGLPMPICNAFALQRLATENLQLGRAEQAMRYASAALEALRELQRVSK